MVLAANQLDSALNWAEAFSLPAFRIYGSDDVKGVEIGAGFRCVEQKGTEHRDEITPKGFLSNHAGGTLGGITTGEDANPFALAPYVSGNKQRGIRNYGMNDSPLNYSNLEYDGNGTTSPHADGEIWSAVNFDISEALNDKYDARFPSNAIAFCMRHAGIAPADLDAVAFYERPLVKFDRLLETSLAFAPDGFPLFREAMPVWAQVKLHLPRITDAGAKDITVKPPS